MTTFDSLIGEELIKAIFVHFSLLWRCKNLTSLMYFLNFSRLTKHLSFCSLFFRMHWFFAIWLACNGYLAFSVGDFYLFIYS